MNKRNSQISIGSCFQFGDGNGKHLHVIVAESSEEITGLVMLVYISSSDSEAWRDDTTILNVGDHPFITKKSWVRYQNIKIENKQSLFNPAIKYEGVISSSVLDRIQDGIKKSKRVPRNIKDIFIEWNQGFLFRDSK